jgi:chemotaxis protein histidine kinase CheA
VTDQYFSDSIRDVYIIETTQLIEKLEEAMMLNEKTGRFTDEAVSEIIRIMHTIKSSSERMRYENIFVLAHEMEDLFYYIREKKPRSINYLQLSDIIFEGLIFLNKELDEVKRGNIPNRECGGLKYMIDDFLLAIKLKNESVVMNRSNNTPPDNLPSIICVNVKKLDKLVDLVGEIVIAEAMVLHNSGIKQLQTDNFSKAFRQLEKVTNELQDIVMAIRIVP